MITDEIIREDPSEVRAQLKQSAERRSATDRDVGSGGASLRDLGVDVADATGAA